MRALSLLIKGTAKTGVRVDFRKAREHVRLACIPFVLKRKSRWNEWVLPRSVGIKRITERVGSKATAQVLSCVQERIWDKNRGVVGEGVLGT